MKKYMFFIKTFLPVIAITLAILGSNSQAHAATTALDATIASLKSEVSQALAQANLAKSATTLADKQSYANKASNIITGSGGVLELASAASIQSQGALDSATESEDADAIAYTTTNYENQNFGVVLNPQKSKKYSFNKNDSIIVLAED